MTRRTTPFWTTWLLAVAAGWAIFGAMIVVTAPVIRTLFNEISFDQSEYPADFSPAAIEYIEFVYAVLGSVMIGWIILVAVVVIGPFRRGERWAWWALALSFGVWFVVDSAFSVALGFAENAVLNSVIAALIAVPLAATAGRANGRQSTVGSGRPDLEVPDVRDSR